MIDAKELRIGNWVQDVNEIIQYVYRIWKDGAELSCDESGSDDLDYKEEEMFGVPLTTEILEKYGFVYGNSGEDIKVEFWDLRVNNTVHSFGTFYFTIVKWSNGDLQFSHHNIRSKCESVHQLQNLYYCLTGTELNIQL